MISELIVSVVIFVVFLYVVYYCFESYFAKSMVLKMLNEYDKGNILLIDDNERTLVNNINDKNKPVNTIYINNNDAFFLSIYSKYDLGLGESYMRGEWSTNDLVGFLIALGLNVDISNKPISHTYYDFFTHDVSSDRKNVQ